MSVVSVLSGLLQDDVSGWGAVILNAMNALPLTTLTVGLIVGLSALVSSLVTMIITERAKAHHQQALEATKADYQRDIERLKTDLGRETETIRAQLSAVAFEHQTRFSRLHERRVSVIAELYRRLVTAERTFNAAFFPLRTGVSHEAIQIKKDADERAAAEAGTAFIDYFQESRVWLDADLCARIERLAKEFAEAWNQYSNAGEEGGKARAMGDAWRRVLNDVPVLRGEIEDAIRTMLGERPPSDATATTDSTLVATQTPGAPQPEPGELASSIPSPWWYSRRLWLFLMTVLAVLSAVGLLAWPR